jgi:hypothetical protein
METKIIERATDGALEFAHLAHEVSQARAVVNETRIGSKQDSFDQRLSAFTRLVLCSFLRPKNLTHSLSFEPQEI